MGMEHWRSNSIPSHHIEFSLYSSRKPALSATWSHLSDLERWLREWTLVINVSKSTAMLFIRGRIQNPRPVVLFGEPILWVVATVYLVVTLDKRLTSTRLETKLPRDWGCWVLS